MRLLSISEFLGHFHPLLVHLPIGILLIALLLQWFSRREKYKAVKPAIPLILLCGIIASAISCITGYLLSVSDDYDKSTVNWHMWMAIAVVFVSFLSYLKELNNDFAVNKKLLSVGLLVLVTVTGHLGGTLTHGSGYISRPLADIFSNDSTSNMVIKPVANVQEAAAYNDVVKPILQTKCYSCHNAGKQKGGLRMDEPARLMKGGKEGKVLQPGNAASSEMIRRLLLPANDDDHMPPKEKPQPSESQVALLQWWVANGADFTKKVKELPQPEKIKPVLVALQHPVIVVPKAPDDIPVDAVGKADEKVLAQLKMHGISIVPVAQSSNYLSANFVTDSIVSAEDLKFLQQIKEQLIWLKLDNTNINDNTITEIAKLGSLTRLNISNTLVTDKGLQPLADLKKLQYLNLTGTRTSPAGLAQLKPLTKLRNLYLFRTNVQSSDYGGLKKIFPAAVIDSGGYHLEKLVSDTTIVKANKTN